MARTEVTLTNAVRNSSAIATVETLAGGATGTNGYALDIGDIADERFLLTVRGAASGATGPITVKAGAYDSADIGDLSVTVAAGGSYVVGPLEGSRFKQADGTISLDCGVTGIVSAYVLP